jgi:hypothetical protein
MFGLYFLDHLRENVRMMADPFSPHCTNNATGPVNEDEQPGFFQLE